MPDFKAAAARLIGEKLLPISQAAALFPAVRGGQAKTLDVSAVVRWIIKGKRGIFLDAMRGPGKSWLTSREAMARFFAALAEAEVGETRRGGDPVTTANADIEEIKRAKRVLEQNREARKAFSARGR